MGVERLAISVQTPNEQRIRNKEQGAKNKDQAANEQRITNSEQRARNKEQVVNEQRIYGMLIGEINREANK